MFLISPSVRRFMAARSTINYVIAAIVIIGILCIVGGVVLVYLGAKGDSTIVAFGFDVKTQSVGIGGIVLGAIVTVTGLRQVLNIIGDFFNSGRSQKGGNKGKNTKKSTAKKNRDDQQKETALNRLVIFAHFRMLAQHAIDRLEHVAHARLRHRAFHHHCQFRLVR
jgi:hypothetical protein